MPAILEHLRTERGARGVLCEGGPTLLRELVAADCVDDLMLTRRADAGGRRRAAPLRGDAARPAGAAWPCATSTAPTTTSSCTTRCDAACACATAPSTSSPAAR